MRTRTPTRVLLVEDSYMDAYLVSAALEHQPYQITHFSDGEEAMDLVDAIETGTSEKPDIILLDINLPKFTGHEILARIREVKTLNDIPVIVVTCSSNPDDIRQVQQRGAHYFEKGHDIESFFSISGLIKTLVGPTRTK